MRFKRRALGPKDVAIKLYYCGVCHSDIHTVRGDWGQIQYPLIVGHELAGEVVAVGSSVNKFRVGARVGVGKIVDTVDVGQMSLVLFRNAIAGSNTGGIRETQEMVDFCALNNIRPDIQKIPMTGIDEAWSKVVDKKARYRFVIDING
jgi:D-arabinose 1-dehydrogenase-like Zn-dependent alcohol dehydrogenase